MNRWKKQWFADLHAHSKLLYIHITENGCKDCWVDVSMANMRIALKPLSDPEIKAAFKELAPMCEIAPDRKTVRLIALETLPFDNDELKKKRKRFVKPKIEEVKLILTDETLAQKFYNHYEGNGWMVGRAKMVDWQATANNWKIEFNLKNNGTNGNGKYPNVFSQKFMDTLSGQELSAYYSHLHASGYKPVKHHLTHKIIDWVKK